MPGVSQGVPGWKRAFLTERHIVSVTLFCRTALSEATQLPPVARDGPNTVSVPLFVPKLVVIPLSAAQTQPNNRRDSQRDYGARCKLGIPLRHAELVDCNTVVTNSPAECHEAIR